MMPEIRLQLSDYTKERLCKLVIDQYYYDHEDIINENNLTHDDISRMCSIYGIAALHLGLISENSVMKSVKKKKGFNFFKLYCDLNENDPPEVYEKLKNYTFVEVLSKLSD